MYSSRNHDSIPAWSSTGADFDTLIAQGDFDALERQSLPPHELIDGNSHFVTAEYRKHIKHIALPMYRRALAESTHHQLDTSTAQAQEERISGMYGEYAQLLESLYHHTDHINRGSDYQAYVHMLGVLTEATFMTLLTRPMTGENSDSYILLPGTGTQDAGDIQADGVRTGVDLTIVDRRTHNQLQTQIKTSIAGAQSHAYREGIMMINLERTAGSRRDIPLLQQALIEEVNGTASDDQHDLIEAAQHRLHSKIKKRFAKQQKQARKFGNLAIEPTQLSPAPQVKP